MILQLKVVEGKVYGTIVSYPPNNHPRLDGVLVETIAKSNLGIIPE